MLTYFPFLKIFFNEKDNINFVVICLIGFTAECSAEKAIIQDVTSESMPVVEAPNRMNLIYLRTKTVLPLKPVIFGLRLFNYAGTNLLNHINGRTDIKITQRRHFEDTRFGYGIMNE